MVNRQIMSTYPTLYCIVVAASYITGTTGKDFCHSPQYLQLGKTGTISCLFEEHFFGVLWYNTTEFTTTDPLVDYYGFIKTGKGFTSGEFDVDNNGSLIINRVSLEHESTFTVAYLNSEEGVPIFRAVKVFVIVKPAVPFPVFDNCGNTSNVCYASVIEPSLHCSVHFSRPGIPLHIVARTASGDRNLSDTTTITPQGDGYTSRVISTDIFKFSKLFVLLVCTASPHSGILENNESFLLAQNSNFSLSSINVTVKYIKENSRLKLSCTDSNAGFIVWKKAASFEDKTPEILLYSLNTGEQLTKVFTDGVTLEGNASLVLSRTKTQQSGYYYCLFGNGVNDGAKLYEVVVLVYPFPAYPVIDGCDLSQTCALKAAHEGSLTCSMYRVHPKVQLEWRTFSKDDASVISFSNHKLTAKKNGETFNVTLTSSFILSDKTRDRLTIECKVTSPKEAPFLVASQIDLLFKDADVHLTGQPDNSSTRSIFVRMIAIVMSLLVLICLVVLGVTFKKHVCNRRISRTEDEEMKSTFIPIQPREMKQIFLTQIREKYKDLYNALQPVPYIKDRLYCVDRVFVEGGIEYLDSRAGGTKEHWASLAAYQDIFDNFHVKSTRIIIEGEPGYGKSTMTLQFAYAWCNSDSIPTSPLKDVEILVLLRLRQLRGVESIYRAIKQFILPTDSRLSESDIEHILQDSKSVVIIFDGFDEYPDQHSTTSDVISIMARKMFQDFAVVLTTRSSFLPKKYAPSTKRLRLTGFDENARRYYIRKAVVGDNDDSIRKMEGYLEENPILRDLCQVPLLFVIFAHMTYESENFRKLHSITSFFRYMISCFHSHMKNKMDDENVLKYELFETDHRDLDKTAFEACSRQSQRYVFEKDEMRQLIGHECYDQYIRIGILVEEGCVNFTDDPGTPITEHVKYKTEVRFYHKIFCEWYAAHYLAYYLQRNPNVDLSEFLRNLDPFDAQYLYRFTCGLCSVSAEKIIDYVKNIEGGDKFAVLCILEQTGSVDNIKEIIRQLCGKCIVISGHDSLLLQRSSLQLLEVAARNEIPIEYVSLNDCLQTVDESTVAITTTSGLVFTSRLPVERLAVTSYNREMTEEEYISTLKFSSKCPSLRHLRFGGCVPPLQFGDKIVLSTLQSRKIKVYWRMRKEYPWYVLNLYTGQWENEVNKNECNETKFLTMRAKFRRQLKSASKDFHKSEVQMMRCRMRKAKHQTKEDDQAQKTY